MYIKHTVTYKIHCNWYIYVTTYLIKLPDQLNKDLTPIGKHEI